MQNNTYKLSLYAQVGHLVWHWSYQWPYDLMHCDCCQGQIARGFGVLEPLSHGEICKMRMSHAVEPLYNRHHWEPGHWNGGYKAESFIHLKLQFNSHSTHSVLGHIPIQFLTTGQFKLIPGNFAIPCQSYTIPHHSIKFLSNSWFQNFTVSTYW